MTGLVTRWMGSAGKFTRSQDQRTGEERVGWGMEHREHGDNNINCELCACSESSVLKILSVLFIILLLINATQPNVMKNADINSKLVESYISLLENMSMPNKLDLISRLTQSVKADTHNTQNQLYESFGEWEGDESADELINVIRESRTFNRSREEF